MADGDPTSEPPLWYEIFQEFMCRIYQVFGGDCADLDWDSGTAALQVVRNAYEEHGIPHFASQREADEFLSNVEALEAHLGSPDATISEDLAGGVRTLVDDFKRAMVL